MTTAQISATRLRRVTDLGYIVESTETHDDGQFVVRFHDGGGLWSRAYGYAIYRGKATREAHRSVAFSARENRDAQIINRLHD